VVRRVVGLTLVVASAVAIWQSHATTARQAEFVERQAELTECQAQVNAALIASLEDSREAAAQERAATDAVFRAVRQDPRAYEQAIDQYLQQRAEADARRAANPLPEPPTRRC
jgi:hypothetical protein